MPKALHPSKVGAGILGFCLLSAQLPGIQHVPPKYQGFVPDSGYRGVIDDPDGYVNLRSGKSTEAQVVAKVKAGEPFSFEREGGDDWCKVKLATRKSGWMHHSRIRLFYTKEDLPARSDQDEIDKQARSHGVNYYEITQGAVRGDQEPRQKFFSVTEYADGSGAEEHWGVLRVVIHLMGDETLASFLRGQPVVYRKNVRDSFPADEVMYPFEPREYLQSHFPKTARVLYPTGGG